jgi:transposase InsO family protein
LLRCRNNLGQFAKALGDCGKEEFSLSSHERRCPESRQTHEVIGWGWFYLSTILDNYSRYIIIWKLCTGMAASDIQDTLNQALEETGLKQANVVHRPRLLSDYGPCYISGDLAEYLKNKGMTHTRGTPYHPQTQDEIERWHQTLKNRILSENYFLPGHLEAHIAAFVGHYNHQRYHESLNNVTPADA